MRKIALSLTTFLATILVVGFVFTSCKKDDFTEKDAINLQNNLEAEKHIAEYTVILVDAGNNNFLKSASAVQSMQGAAVTLTIGDQRTTSIADSIGMVTFTNIPAGVIGVNVKLAGYSVINFTKDLESDEGGNGTAGGIKRSDIIPMIPLVGTSTAILQGRITYESDLTNLTPESAGNVVVLASVQVSGSPILNSIKTGNDFETFTYGELNMYDTTDAGGNYSIVVPSLADGLQYNIEVLDFEANQTLLMPTMNGEENLGVVTVTTRFGSRQSGPSDVIKGYPAYIVFPDPNANKVNATAVATIDSDQAVESVNITNSGDGYNLVGNSFYSYINGPDLVDDYAIIEVHLDPDFKRVTHATIDRAGKGHATTNNVYLNRMAVFEVTAVGATDGDITGLTAIPAVSNFYNDAMNDDLADPDYLIPVDIQDEGDVIIVTETGSNAEIEIIFNNLGMNDDLGLYEFQITGYSITDAGDGYKVGDFLCIPLDPDVLATGVPNIEASSVTAIAVTNTGAGYVSGQVTVLLENVSGNGQDATATATVVNGKIAYITVTNGGFGYTAVPSVVIINELVSEQAPVVYIDRNLDGTLKETFAVLNTSGGYSTASFPMGAGYITPINATITSSVGGSGAAVSVQVNASGEISAILLTNPGADYDGINTPSSESNPETGSAFVKGAGNVYRDVYLSTGVRIIEE